MAPISAYPRTIPTRGYLCQGSITPPPVPSVRPGHSSIRRGVGQLNGRDSRTVAFLSQHIASIITSQCSD